MEQGKNVELISALLAVDQSLSIGDYHSQMDTLLKGVSSDEIAALKGEVEVSVGQWRHSNPKNPNNPYHRVLSYFNPAGAA